MKKSVLFGLTLSAFISICALGCSHGSSDETENDGEPIGSGNIGITFNISNAKALAGAQDDGSAKSAREATDSSKLLKILEDGNIESAISVPEDLHLANVTAVLQAPSSSDIFIIFDGTSWGSGYWDEASDKWISEGLSQLICVHSDGSYDDVLGWDNINGNASKWIWCYNSDYSNSIKFDDNGNLYYLCSEQSGNSSSNVFYRYDSKTKTNRQLTVAQPNIYYERFDVSKDGKYLFVEGSSSDRFLRVIPVDDPDDVENIVYGSWNFSWVYDNYTNYLYLCENTYCYNDEEGGISRFAEKDDFLEKEWVKKSRPGYYLYTYADGHTEEKDEYQGYDADPSDENDYDWSYPQWVDATYYDYRDLTATKGGIWGTTYAYNGSSTEYSVIKILDDNREYDGTIVDLPEGYSAISFRSTSSNLFALADIMKGKQKSGYQTLFKVSSDGGEWTNIFVNTPNPAKTNIFSWSASNDGSTVFFSGAKGLTITNGTIDAASSNYTEISSGTKFSCITALY